MTAASPIRVLQDPPLDGPTNMARDETLLLRVGRGESPSTLRLYQWGPPTISLGYFQSFADCESLSPPAGTLPVVRRLTGGGAILHDLEVTYSLTLPITHTLVAGDPKQLYQILHQAVAACLASIAVEVTTCGKTDDSTPTRGPFFCFARRHTYDLLLGKDKIVGSAQRRTRDAILQHGSIIYGSRFPQQQTAVLSVARDEVVEHIRRALCKELEALSGMTLELGQWTDAELRGAEGLTAKYAGREWTRRR